MNFNKFNPFKKREQVKKPETIQNESVQEEFVAPISEAAFMHELMMFSPGKNQILTEYGEELFVQAIKDRIASGETTQEQVLRDLKKLPSGDFYEKYKNI